MNSTQTTNADDSSLPDLSDLEAQVQAQGHEFYGIFADDPGAMEVFDEIERLRDQQLLIPASRAPTITR